MISSKIQLKLKIDKWLVSHLLHPYDHFLLKTILPERFYFP